MFGSKARKIAELKRERRYQDDLHANQATEIRQLRKETEGFAARSVEIQSLRAEIDKGNQAIRAVKRAETEADLFFVSHKILAELIQGKAVAEVKLLVEQQRRLQQQLADMEQPRFGSLTDGMLTNVFGGYPFPGNVA